LPQISEKHGNGPGGGSQVAVDEPGGAAITNTATDNRQIEFALKYTF
jgi:hypothetical protein